MISLAAVLVKLRTLLGLAETAKEVVEVVVDAARSEKGQPLSHKDVRHQQDQIRSATRPKR